MLIRPARDKDYAAFARLFVELRVDDPTPNEDTFRESYRPRMFVAHLGETVVGYAYYELLDGVGYVRNLVSAPASRREGIGRKLMEQLHSTFVEAGARRWCLNVKPENTPAVSLYQSFGMSVAYASTALRVPVDGEPWQLGFSLEVRPMTPAEEAEQEHAFGLLLRQLSGARMQRGTASLAFAEEGRVVAVAAFKKDFAGAFPFRVRNPEHGPDVFELLRRLADPKAPFFQVVVEDDRPLRSLLNARGAAVSLDFVHMVGTL